MKDIAQRSIKEFFFDEIHNLGDVSEAVSLVLGLLETSVPWGFRFNERKNMVGLCNVRKKILEISKPHAEILLKRNKGELVRTILHEIAHVLALDAVNYKKVEKPHGPIWQGYCEVLGIPDERAGVDLDYVLDGYRYALQNRETGEIYQKYFRKPKKHDFSKAWIRGKKGKTLGKLQLISL